MEDERFTHVVNDPKFRRIPKREQKIKVDERFKSMFKDKKFKVKYTTDKRGRPISHTSTEDLKRYYEISSEGDFSDSGEENNESEPPTPHECNDLSENDRSDETISNALKQKLRNLDIDYARGESALCSESSSDEVESEEDIYESDEIEHKWGELDVDAEQTEEPTYRLAACNMDWDRIRALDLMVLFNSFLPPGGVIQSVAIYSSEFGKKRMAEEEVKGPIELVEYKAEDNDNENDEGSSYHMEKLRQYQLNRLKYYYAVITFDSSNSANKIYMDCDGMEYESSATKIDLRFIPNDMEFDDKPTQVCDKLPEVNKYQPRFFTTTALQQAKVNLTWDETNPERLEIAEKLRNGKVDGISEIDLQNYLASSSEEEEESEEEKQQEIQNEKDGSVIDKYKALLQDIEKKEQLKNHNDMEMEISWGINLKEKTEKLIKEKTANKEKTPFEQYLEKRREKRREKRDERKKRISKTSNCSDSDIPSDIDMSDKYFAEEFENSYFKNKKSPSKLKHVGGNNEEDNHKQAELELLLINEDNSRNHFNLKEIQQRQSDESKYKTKKKKTVEKEADDNFQINVSDERFSALFTSHHFNIDPTDPHYKRTKAMQTLVSEKLKRRNDNNLERNTKKMKVNNKISADLNLLVKSVKSKVGTLKST